VPPGATFGSVTGKTEYGRKARAWLGGSSEREACRGEIERGPG
jgi:hypothetical protein